MARVKRLDTPPQRWDWGSVPLDSSRFRYKKFVRKARELPLLLRDRVRALGHPPPDADEKAQALDIFKRLNTPNALPASLRASEGRKARDLLRESREFARLMIAHPLLGMLILTPAAWGVWETRIETHRTLDYRLQLADMVLAGKPLREVCKAAGVSRHFRGIVGSVHVLTAANHALMNRPQLVGAWPKLGAWPKNAELDKWLWAIAWATPTYYRSRLPSAESLLWAGRHADRFLAHSRKRILPDWMARLRRYLWESQPGERNAFSPHRDWEATWRTLEAWEADKAAEREARLSGKDCEKIDREKIEREAQRARAHDAAQALRAAPRAVRQEEDERAEFKSVVVEGKFPGVKRARAMLEQRRDEHLCLVPDAIFADGWRIIVLRTRFDLTAEGQLMCHCMGRSDYWPSDPYRNRAWIAASLRDPSGNPKISFDFLLPESTTGQYTLSRMRARCNKRPPADRCLYRIEDWLDFLNAVAPDRRAELAKRGPFDMREAEAEALI